MSVGDWIAFAGLGFTITSVLLSGAWWMGSKIAALSAEIAGLSLAVRALQDEIHSERARVEHVTTALRQDVRTIGAVIGVEVR